MNRKTKIINYLKSIGSNYLLVLELYNWVEKNNVLTKEELDGYYSYILSLLDNDEILVFASGIISDFKKRYPNIFEDYYIHKKTKKLFN